MACPSNSGPFALNRRKFIGRLWRLGIQGLAAASLWPIKPAMPVFAASTPVRTIFPMDAAAPTGLITATFGLG